MQQEDIQIDFTLYTLFDVTRTDTLRVYNATLKNIVNKQGNLIDNEQSWNHSRNQHRNWQTVLQLLGLRSQVNQINDSKHLRDQNLGDYDFGKNHQGTQSIWKIHFEFSAFREVEQHHTAIEFLVNDFAMIPMIVGLNETATFQKNCFETTGDDLNIYFVRNKL